MTYLKYSQLAGQKVKEIRIAKNMTVKQLAQAAKLSISTIYRIETGKLDINLFTIYKLCKAFQIKELDFIKSITYQKRT